MAVPSFTLVQLRYFAAAVDKGRMTAAATELLVSQSAVSTAMEICLDPGRHAEPTSPPSRLVHDGGIPKVPESTKSSLAHKLDIRSRERWP